MFAKPLGKQSLVAILFPTQAHYCGAGEGADSESLGSRCLSPTEQSHQENRVVINHPRKDEKPYTL